MKNICRYFFRGTPGTPASAGKPSNPGNPAKPGTPGNASNPATPGNPGTPHNSAKPAGRVGHDARLPKKFWGFTPVFSSPLLWAVFLLPVFFVTAGCQIRSDRADFGEGADSADYAVQEAREDRVVHADHAERGQHTERIERAVRGDRAERGDRTSSPLPPGDPENAGLLLPGGFEAVAVVDSLGRSRHIAVSEHGDVYVNVRVNRGGTAVLRDTTNNGKADVIQRFGVYPDEGGGTGMAIYDGYLYSSNAGGVYRYRLTPGNMVPESELEVIMAYDYRNARHGFEHTAKPVTFDHEGNMYVPFGSPSDVCQELNRIPESPGQDPCPELEEYGGIWRFDAHATGQPQQDGMLYATGIRSVTAFDWNFADSTLYVVQHGRDYLVRMWPGLFTRWESAMLPSEQFMRVTKGSDFGWPYCYHDQLQDKKVLNPEYGGDGEKVGRCSEFEDPLFGFPGHFAPNDLHFYRGDQFPERYRNGAFVAFHGSTSREGYPQAGYFVAFVPFADGEPSRDWEVFANGFAGHDPLVHQSDAEHRPMGLATGPGGSLYIVESVQGKVWRVMFKGDKDSFGREQLAVMEREKQMAGNIRTPDVDEDDLMRNDEVTTLGETVYQTYCSACHGVEGGGAYPRWPPLSRTEWVTGDKQRLISVIINGLEGPIEVRGQTYDQPMPPHGFLEDEQVAAVATYIRQNFGNDASAVTMEEVREVRGRRPERED